MSSIGDGFETRGLRETEPQGTEFQKKNTPASQARANQTWIF